MSGQTVKTAFQKLKKKKCKRAEIHQITLVKNNER